MKQFCMAQQILKFQLLLVHNHCDFLNLNIFNFCFTENLTDMKEIEKDEEVEVEIIEILAVIDIEVIFYMHF